MRTVFSFRSETHGDTRDPDEEQEDDKGHAEFIADLQGPDCAHINDKDSHKVRGCVQKPGRLRHAGSRGLQSRRPGTICCRDQIGSGRYLSDCWHMALAVSELDILTSLRRICMQMISERAHRCRA